MNLIYDIKLNLLKISVCTLSLIYVTISVRATGIDSLFRSDEIIKMVFEKYSEFYRKLRPVFESIINNQDLISSYSRRRILRYINEFYTVIDNKYLIRRNILNVCETRQDYNLID